ncbi:hypothetical protein GYMLUDRAFT_383469 [Collybiopsis luxurians FD-317 M1]|nr:hypothetical protein GYMLUDRAFT_383469 [Collybiopsis luxurians FD-317 M1]
MFQKWQLCKEVMAKLSDPKFLGSRASEEFNSSPTLPSDHPESEHIHLTLKKDCLDLCMNLQKTMLIARIWTLYYLLKHGLLINVSVSFWVLNSLPTTPEMIWEFGLQNILFGLVRFAPMTIFL